LRIDVVRRNRQAAGVTTADDAPGSDLEAHPEGGSYRRIWTSDLALPASVLPADYDGDRLAGTCIAYALAPGERSRWHRVRSTELWLWQGGGRLRLRTGGTGDTPAEQAEILLGPDATLVAVVAPWEWQTAEPVDDEHVRVACVVVPGFDWRDWEVAPD
jgi:predicted cupin superfamily sugar epimerase